MQLSDIEQSCSLADIAADRDLAREIQGALLLAGVLDPPVDGLFGPVSTWAFTHFIARLGADPNSGLSPAIAAALLASRGNVPQLDLSAGDLASKLAGAMERRGYWISRVPDCMTIVYVEGIDAEGVPNSNPPNAFNDVRALFQVDQAGVPHIAGIWEGTTEPGRYFTDHPLDPAGAARIAFGQYKAWSVGTHHAGTQSAHEALVQVAPITIYRDRNRDYAREGDTRFTGIFAINQHWGYDLPLTDLSNSSAGCLVGRTRDGHRAFMRLVKNDPRYGASHGYRFMTAVLPANALAEAAFSPKQPH